MPWPLTQPSAVVATDVTAQTTRHAADHNSIAALLAVLTPGPWQYVNPVGGVTPAFATGWINYGGGLSSGWQVARFRREGGDICRIEGLIAGGTSGTAVFTLPIGFRPPQYVRYASPCQATTGGQGLAYVDVPPTGAVGMAYNLSGLSGAVVWVSLNLTFTIDPATL